MGQGPAGTGSGQLTHNPLQGTSQELFSNSSPFSASLHSAYFRKEPQNSYFSKQETTTNIFIHFTAFI